MSSAAALTCLIFAAALLYSTVGNAGATGYLAVMALMGVSTEVMKPAALVLNILVATVATVRFYRAGCFSWSTLWPFVIGAVPLAFGGGAIQLPANIYLPAAGALLLLAAVHLVFTAAKGDSVRVKRAPLWASVMAGGAIGLMSGLTGTGGGLFLSSLLLFFGWATTRETAGVSAAYVLVTSTAGLAGNFAIVRQLPSEIGLWGLAAVMGGLIGAELGSRRLAPRTLRYLLAGVLFLAGSKMLFF